MPDKVSAADKIAALTLLAKIHGMLTNKKAFSGPDGAPLSVDHTGDVRAGIYGSSQCDCEPSSGGAAGADAADRSRWSASATSTARCRRGQSDGNGVRRTHVALALACFERLTEWGRAGAQARLRRTLLYSVWRMA
jgi:hypothetical protein